MSSYGSSILDAAIKTYQPLDAMGAITGAQKIKENDSILAQHAQELELGGLKLEEAQQEMPLKAALTKAQTKNSLLHNAISTATDAQSWDSNMRELAKEFPEAGQYIGRYSPVLQNRLGSVYGGQPDVSIGGTEGGAGASKEGAAPASAGFDAQFAQSTPEARATTLQNLGKFTQAIEQVSDQASWDAMKQKLHAEGVPLMDQLGDYSPIKAAQVYQNVQPILSYLQKRVVADQAGVPDPRGVTKFQALGNSLFAVDPYTNKASKIASAPEYQATTNAYGEPMIFDKSTGKMQSQSPQDGVFGFDNFADKMNSLENASGDRTAKNANSSATGNGQFTDGTWLDTIKATRPELAENMNDKQLLQLRKDPAFSKEMTAEYAQKNAGILEQNGEHVNATSLALAHRFGPQGALAVLKAAPDAKLSSVLSADAIKANPGLEKETAGGYVKDLAGRVGLDNIGSPDQASEDGGDPYKGIPQAQIPQIKAMLEGRMAPPTSAALRTPYWQRLMAAANRVDPTFDQTQWGARASARKDFTGGGTSYKTLNSGNTAIQHLGRLFDQIPDVASHKIPLIGNMVNAGENAVAGASGVAGINAYNDTLGHLAEETTKFYRGTGGAESDVERNMSNLSPSLSKEQKEAGVANTVHLIFGKLQPMVEQYNATMGTKYDASHFLSGEAVKTMKRMGFDPNTGEKIEKPASSGAPTKGDGWTVKRVDK